jgi:hypothetical protein
VNWRELDDGELRVALLEKFTLIVDPFDESAATAGWEPGVHCPSGAIDVLVRRRWDPQLIPVIENALG